MDKEPYENNEHVKFVFYNGESPVLCRGLLMLEIDGEIHTFGKKSYYPQAEYPVETATPKATIGPATGLSTLRRFRSSTASTPMRYAMCSTNT